MRDMLMECDSILCYSASSVREQKYIAAVGKSHPIDIGKIYTNY